MECSLQSIRENQSHWRPGTAAGACDPRSRGGRGRWIAGAHEFGAAGGCAERVSALNPVSFYTDTHRRSCMGGWEHPRGADPE
uniref:Uncharacterized protein n=1 Tax=Terrapene triunguis TaxID=2587831 RepID=A0A674ITH3_9SAUR